jgi:putative transposase
MVTARCRGRVHHFQSEERRDHLLQQLAGLAEQYSWTLEAWAVMSNHYHLVAHSDAPKNLRRFLTHLHGNTARHVNRLDNSPGRQVWQNFRDTHLTFEVSYLSRLNYVHQNPVHHGLVSVATQYPWCSAAAFEKEVTPAWAKIISRFKYDQIAKDDGE